LEAKNSDFKSYWWDLVRFNIDLTGPDSGLGYDDGSDPLVRDYETKQGSSVIKGVYIGRMKTAEEVLTMKDLFVETTS